MGILLGILISVIAGLIAYYLMRPPAPKVENKKAAAFDELEVPTATAGREIPVVFGTRWVKSPNVVWYGNYSARPKEKEGHVMYWKYWLGMHLIICHAPIDAILKITSGDKVVDNNNHTNAIGNTSIEVDDTTLYGGTGREGGVRGTIDIEFGASTQAVNTYLENYIGLVNNSYLFEQYDTVPAFRGVVGIVLHTDSLKSIPGMYVGRSSYIKRWAFEIQKCDMPIPVTWASTATADLTISSSGGTLANPIAVLYLCLTNSEWGMGYNDSDINASSFDADASTLSSEGLGISLIWNSQLAIEDFVNEILTHINGVLYVEPITGEFTTKLIRALTDTEKSDLTVFDEDNIISVNSYKRKAKSELYNTVIIKYKKHGSLKDEDASITLHNTALIQELGQVISQTIEYPGIAAPEIANRVGQRELQSLSSELSSVEFDANADASELRKGDAFKFSWAKYGITEEIMRVIDIDFGTIKDSKIRVSAIQDVFGAINETYADSPDTEWENPVKQITVISDSEPHPTGMSEGDKYIVPDTADSLSPDGWEENVGNIAEYIDPDSSASESAPYWDFTTPTSGYKIYITDNNTSKIYVEPESSSSSAIEGWLDPTYTADTVYTDADAIAAINGDLDHGTTAHHDFGTVP